MLTIKENIMEIVNDGQISLLEIEKVLGKDDQSTTKVYKDLILLSCIEKLAKDLED